MLNSTDFIALTPAEILRALPGEHAALHLHVLSTVDSTNQFLKINPPATDGLSICVAEEQTAGRGRFGRTWHSPNGQHLYVSMRQVLPVPASELAALSLLMGLALVNTIEALGLPTADLRLKWPNDLLWCGKKLSGVLIETVVSDLTHTDLIIGIGLNVNSEKTPPWCSLREIGGYALNRNTVLAQLIQQVRLSIAGYLATGFAPYMPAWQTLDYLYSQRIRVVTPSSEINGQAQGITTSGLLIVVDDQQQRYELSAGEASLSSAGLD